MRSIKQPSYNKKYLKWMSIRIQNSKEITCFCDNDSWKYFYFNSIPTALIFPFPWRIRTSSFVHSSYGGPSLLSQTFSSFQYVYLFSAMCLYLCHCECVRAVSCVQVLGYFIFYCSNSENVWEFEFSLRFCIILSWVKLFLLFTRTLSKRHYLQ